MAVKIKVEGVIYSWEVADILREIEAAGGKDLYVEVSSPGGIIYAGLRLYNVLKNYPGNVHTHNMGLAASMASVILLAGDKVTAESASVLMIHNASVYTEGDYREMQKSANYLEGLTNVLANIYAEKTGKSLKDIRALMDDESYFFGSEMKDAGFVDSVAQAENAGDRGAAISLAKLDVENCVAELKSNEKATEDLEKAAAIFKGTAQDEKPRNNADTTKKVEVKKMDFKQFLAENPAAKAEYDTGLKAQYDAGVSAVEAKIKKVSVYLVDTEAKTYSAAVKNLAVKVLTGESDVAALEGAVTVLDAQDEEKKSVAAKKEGIKDTPASNQDETIVADDGTVNNEASHAAAVKRVKGESA